MSDYEEEERQEALDEATKKVVKEAINEWLDSQFALFGKWTFNGLLAAAFVALIYFVLTSQGWKQIH
jgi:hypothetical protein